jgi:glycosyltransferase involved in cell wall biosynthesis
MTSAVLPSVVHVPMPQGTQGSTLLRVAERLSEAHSRAGGDAAVVLAAGLGTDGARVLPVAYGAVRFDESALRQDVVRGRLGRLRPHFGHVYDPAVEVVAAERPDVVLLYEGHYAAASLPQWDRLRQGGARVLLYVHNALSRSYGRSELRRLLRCADGVVFVAAHLRAQAEERLGRGHGVPLAVVHNGVDELFRAAAPRVAPEGEFVVTVVGNVVLAKGPHLVCQAADLAARLTGRPFRVCVVGDAWYGRGGLTPFEAWLREQCATLGTPVDFVPHVDRHRVAELLRDSSAACFPSEVEGLPMAVLEAMASGLPVVCSEIAGMREVGGDAVLARPRDDVEALADALASLAEDPALYAERSRRAWERARGFSWERAASQLAQL